jgi:plastocyanin
MASKSPFPLSLSKGVISKAIRASTSSARTVQIFLFVSIIFFGSSTYAAELKGQVLLDGPPPAAEKVAIEPKKGGNHSTEGCGSLLKDSQKLRVDASGGVRDAVVWVELQGSGGQAEGPVLIDQNQCIFEPHVAAIPAGGQIAVRNSDSVIHNIRIFEEGKPSMLMHLWQKADAADIPWRFEKPGRYVVRCGVHHWMYAWVLVVPPGARAGVTDASGRFTLADLPPGRHTLRVWHETLGTKEIPVKVPADGLDLDPILLTLTGSGTAVPDPNRS